MPTLTEVIVATGIGIGFAYSAKKLYNVCTKPKNDNQQETKVAQEMKDIKMKQPLSNDKFAYSCKNTV